MDSAYTNILLIKPGAIGDLLQLTPVIRALANRYPGARISLLVGTRETAALFQHNPHVSDVMVFDRRGEHRTFPAFLKLWSRLLRKKYDLVIHFQRSNLKAWLLAAASMPCRVLVYHKAKNPNIHVVENYFETVAPLGISAEDRSLELFTGEDDERFAENMFSGLRPGPGPVIALNPGASHHVNRWSAERFTALADALAERVSATIIIIGGKEDENLAQSISAASASKPLVMAGKATLLQLGAVLRRCDLLISGDTGPLHLATAVRTRVIALFGAADPARTGPVGPGHRVIQAKDAHCAPCRSRVCSNKVYLDCMEKITVQDVMDVVLDMMKNPVPRQV